MKQIVPVKQRSPVWMLLLLLLAPLVFHNAACTMFLVKEGYKEVKKLEDERKEKKQEQQRQEQWERQQTPDSSDTPPSEPVQRRHHGQWTPQRGE